MWLGLRALGRLLRIDVPAVAVVTRDLLARGLLRAQGGEALLRAEAEVRRASVHELLRGLLVERQALRLDIWGVRTTLARALIPADVHPAEAVVDRVDRARNEAVLVGVLDPEDERALVLAREEIVVERRPHAPDMERAGGRGREPNADRHEVQFMWVSLTSR